MFGDSPASDKRQRISADTGDRGGWGSHARASGWGGGADRSSHHGSGNCLHQAPAGGAASRSGWGAAVHLQEGARSSAATWSSAAVNGSSGWGADVHQSRTGGVPTRSSGWGATLHGMPQDQSGAAHSYAVAARSDVGSWGATSQQNAGALKRGNAWGATMQGTQEDGNTVAAIYSDNIDDHGKTSGRGVAAFRSQQERDCARSKAHEDISDATLPARLFGQVCGTGNVDDPSCNAELPIVAHRQSILSFVERNQVIIVTGETGSGKTTQVSVRTIMQLLPVDPSQVTSFRTTNYQSGFHGTHRCLSSFYLAGQTRASLSRSLGVSLLQASPGGLRPRCAQAKLED